MSARGRRSRRARKRPLRPDALALYDPERMTTTEAAIAAARAQGCTCNPEVSVEGAAALLRHDFDCALLRRRDVN